MKQGIKLLIAAGLAAGLAGTAFVDASRAGGGRHGGHQGSGRGPSLIERFDTDQDGKLTQAEIDQARDDRLARFDTDGDGRLSLKEFEALWLDHVRERMVDSFQYLDNDGDGAITGAEYRDPFASIVADKDKNDDGALERGELRRRHDPARRHGGKHRQKSERHHGDSRHQGGQHQSD